jgi:hypothetical protein
MRTSLCSRGKSFLSGDSQMNDTESKAIWLALSKLQVHHTRQIDENRVSCRRTDELEEKIVIISEILSETIRQLTSFDYNNGVVENDFAKKSILSLKALEESLKTSDTPILF